MKIKPKDLRIGNKIIYNNEIHTLHTIGNWCYSDLSVDEIPCDKFIPILLERDNLKEYGFLTKDEQNYIISLPHGEASELCLEFFREYEIDVCVIRSHTKDNKVVGDMDYVYIKSIRYLHELQNQFYFLSGHELNNI